MLGRSVLTEARQVRGLPVSEEVGPGTGVRRGLSVFADALRRYAALGLLVSLEARPGTGMRF